MTVLKSETTPLQTEADIFRVRQTVRQWAIQQVFSLVTELVEVGPRGKVGHDVSLPACGPRARP